MLKKLNRVIAPAFYILLIVFLVLYLRHVDFGKLAHVHIAWGYLVLSVFVALGARYLGSFTWFTILRSLGARELHIHKAMVAVYAKAWLGRYIPGTAPWILGKIYFASKHGVSKQKLAVSALLEGGLQITTLLVFSLLLLMFDKRLDVLGGGFKILMMLVALAGIVILLPPVYNRIVGKAYRLLRRKALDAENKASAETITRGAALYLVDAAVSGFSLFFIAKGVDPGLAWHNIVFVIGAASLATVVSMLAIFAPGGLGVREGIQLVLFSLIMPKELAVMVTVLMRLWSVCVDLLFFALTRPWAR